MSSTYLVYDIETKANPRAKHYFDMLGEKGYYTAPSNWKDEAKIKAYCEEQKDKDRGKAALYWWTGQIVLISAWLVRSTTKTPMLFANLEDEEEVLRAFFDYLEETNRTVAGLRIIGKQAKEFDQGYINGRAMCHDIGLPFSWRGDRPIDDVNDIFSRAKGSNQVGTLEDYAYGLSIPLKLGDGSQVPKWAAEGNIDAIIKYGARDIEITAEIVRRYLKPYAKKVAANG